MTTDVSVVIPMFNEAASLPSLFAALAAQTALPREVICVDSGSTDGSDAIVCAIITANDTPFEVRLITNPGGMPGGNRNVGIDAARGEWIAFLDGGVLPEPTWLERLVACASTRRLTAVYGRCKFVAEPAFERAVCAVSYGVDAVHPVLPASMFHRSVFKDVGLFRPELRAAEDLIWLREYERKRGVRPVCDDALIIYDRFPHDFPTLIHKWRTYEQNRLAAGIRWRGRFIIPFAVVGLLAAMALWPRVILPAVLVAVIVRGVLEPIRRSVRWDWWRGVPTAAVLAIGVCFVRDVTKVSVQLIGVAR